MTPQPRSRTRIPARTRTRLAAVGAAVLVAVSAGAATAASGGGSGPDREREAAALTGTGELYRSAGDDITFAFDAQLAAEHKDNPLKAEGTFRFSHYVDGKGAYAKGSIDCLLTGGKVAVASGTITESDLPGAKGKRVGFTVHDKGRKGDRLGYSWASTGTPVEMDDLPKCVSSAPFEKVKTGGFKVTPWDPPL